MSKKKRLGRGLDALLSKPESAATPVAPQPAGDRLQTLPVELLQRGQYQPRSDIRKDTLDELADSIKAQGVVQPIVVRPLAGNEGGNARYEIIAGERRWRAAQLAGLTEVPAVVRDLEDDAAIAMALIENIQREDLNPLEEATALDRLVFEFELTHQQAAEAVGRSRAAVSNLLRLLELSDKVKPMLAARELEMGHARALLGIDDPGKQYAAAKQVVRQGLSVRDTERLVSRQRAGKTPAGKAPQLAANADVRRLETEVSGKLGAKVRIAHKAKGNGQVQIDYNSLDELEGILAHIN